MGVRLIGQPPRRMTPARRRLIECCPTACCTANRRPRKEAGVSAGVIDGLVDEGTLAVEAMPRAAGAAGAGSSFAQPEFSRQQRTAVDAMRALAANGSFHVALLDGVTGSGKTEVYFEAIAEIIRRGKQSLILMPEIALTGQFLDRFAQRFGVRPLEWHSELTPRTRARNWAAIAAGEAPVVVGARSALFMPYADLGLIVVDEEHDQAYKQDEGAHYHARDMAVVRAHIAKIPIVLASATPSVETEVNARKGRYQRVVLPSRFGGQHMPHIEAIDLRREPPPRGRFISPRLAEQIGIAIERREQALLFLNRRGYAPLTLCRACGHRFACTICDAWLVDHRFRQRLVCHHCGFSMPRPHACPHCAAEESLVAVGPGVERLQEEAAALFPDARTMVLSSDLITSIETMRSELNEIAEGRVDIIIGTQLVAKGHHFPRLNLVGVVDADLGLSNGDPRAAERTFQLLNQVIGRAGRDQGRGVGYLQTHQPEHPVMKALVACDREAFYASEIEIARTRRLSAVRTAREPDHLRRRSSDRRRFCAQARRDRADRRTDPGAGARRSAARGHQGPLSVPAIGEVAAQCRRIGILARMARRGPKTKAISSSRSTSIRRAFCGDAVIQQKSLPSFATAGLFGAQKFRGRYATQRLPNLHDEAVERAVRR